MSGETGRIAIPKKALGTLRLFSGHPPAVSAPSRVLLAMLPGTPRPAAARLSRAPTTAPAASAKAPAGKPQARSAIEGDRRWCKSLSVRKPT